MNFLRKILLVAVIAWNMGSTEATLPASLPAPPPPPTLQSLPAPANDAPRLDFNNIITFGATVPASFQSKTHARPTVGTPSVRCIYFTVSSVSNNVNFGVALHQVPNVQDHNIYFPVDGRQPTTPEAVEYSCANVDNTLNSPITEWYMQMFGVIPINSAPASVYIQAGWDNARPNPNVRPIISFDASVEGTNVNDPDTPGQQISRLNLFKREFRKIASTSVGRVLLYRILIEIRRHIVGNDVGCAEMREYCRTNILLNQRNNGRGIKIFFNVHDTSGYGFAVDGRSIRFASGLPILAIIGKSNTNGETGIVRCCCPVDVALFHEMMHWYHHLRNIYRTNKEWNKERNPLTLTDSDLGRYYWANLTSDYEYENSCKRKWSSAVALDPPIDFEEMRTILGLPCEQSMQSQNYLQGDDLSENLYRVCIGVPLRFSYNDNLGFYEYSDVIIRVINASRESYLFYVRGYDGKISSINNLAKKCEVI